MDIHDDLYRHIAPDRPYLYRAWEPDGIAVVLGAAQKPETETHLDQCQRDGIPIIKRRGGGGAVVLMPGMVCLTLAFLSDLSPFPYFFFNRINQFIVRVLQTHFAIQDLHLAGISDIAIGDRKILGCSIFKSRNLFFYQGSLLVEPDLSLIPLYLQHPSREPDYRMGRGHLDFITSLKKSRYLVSASEVRWVFEQELNERLEAIVRGSE